MPVCKAVNSNSFSSISEKFTTLRLFFVEKIKIRGKRNLDNWITCFFKDIKNLKYFFLNA